MVMAVVLLAVLLVVLVVVVNTKCVVDVLVVVAMVLVVLAVSITTTHLCFEQAQPNMYHSPKVDDGVDVFFSNFLKTNFRTFFFGRI